MTETDTHTPENDRNSPVKSHDTDAVYPCSVCGQAIVRLSPSHIRRLKMPTCVEQPC